MPSARGAIYCHRPGRRLRERAAVGITRFEVNAAGICTPAVTCNLIVGTVGGGTALPSQHACLDIMGLAGSGHARALAEVCAAAALAGNYPSLAPYLR